MTLRIMIAIILATTLCAAGIYMWPDKRQPSSSIKVESLPQDFEIIDLPIDAHPFSWKPSYATPSDGTNSEISTKLNKYDLYPALDSMMRDQGRNIVRDTFIKFEGYQIPVTTYDPDARVGYLFVNHLNMGDGLQNGKLGNPIGLEACKNQVMIDLDEGIELMIDDEDQFLMDLFDLGVDEDIISKRKSRDSILTIRTEVFDSISKGLLEWKDASHHFQTFSAIPAMDPTILDDWTFFASRNFKKSDYVKEVGKEVAEKWPTLGSTRDKRDYMETVLLGLKSKLEFDRLSATENKSVFDEWKLSAMQIFDDPLQILGVCRLINNMRLYQPSPELNRALWERVFECTVEKDRKTWTKKTMAIIDLFNENKVIGLNQTSYYNTLLTDILQNTPVDNWPDRYPEIHQLAGTISISSTEIEGLPWLAKKKGIFIAPISIFDQRLVYDMKDDEFQESLKQLRDQISKIKSAAKTKRLRQELLEKTNDRASNFNAIRKEAKMIQGKKLQNDLKEFFQWASRQSKSQ